MIELAELLALILALIGLGVVADRWDPTGEKTDAWNRNHRR